MQNLDAAGPVGSPNKTLTSVLLLPQLCIETWCSRISQATRRANDKRRQGFNRRKDVNDNRHKS